MTLTNTFNIAFFGSSSFVLPILSDIESHNGQELGSLAKKQLNWVVSEQIKLLDTLPHSLVRLAPSLFDQPCLKRNINLSLVVTQPDKEIRGKTVSNIIAEYARKQKLTLYTPVKINDDLKTFDRVAAGADIAIVASFGQLLSSDVLATTRFGFLNWHPSNLPLYRGSTPMQTCLANGDKETGLSWIDMNEYMDAGDIYLQLQSPISKTTDFNQLATQLGAFGKETWALVTALRVLEGLKAEGEEVDTGLFVAKRQDYGQATKTNLISKGDRIVDVDSQSAKTIHNHFRAYAHFPGTWYVSEYFNQEVKLTGVKSCISVADFTSLVSKSRSLGEQDEWHVLSFVKEQRAFLKCKDGYLEVERVCLASGKNIDFAGFVFQSKEEVLA
jgi:methionyl-tRNA formyltransferase